MRKRAAKSQRKQKYAAAADVPRASSDLIVSKMTKNFDKKVQFGKEVKKTGRGGHTVATSAVLMRR